MKCASCETNNREKGKAFHKNSALLAKRKESAMLGQQQ